MTEQQATASESGKNRITIDVSRGSHTGGIQLSINQLDENGSGHGYRIAGPKFLGSSETLLTRDLDQRDADEIRRYLDAVFPQKSASDAAGHGSTEYGDPQTEWGVVTQGDTLVDRCTEEAGRERIARQVAMGIRVTRGVLVRRDCTAWRQADASAEAAVKP